MNIDKNFINGIKKKYPNKPARIYGVVSGKGGVGKTSLSSLLSYGIASKGYATLVMDMDTGLRNLDVVMGIDNRVVRNLFDVLERGEDFSNAVIKAKKPTDEDGKVIADANVPWVCLSDQLKIKNAINEELFQQLLTQLRDVFDVIILDAPAGIEYGCRLVTESVDEGFIVCTPELSSLRSVDQLVNIFDQSVPLSLIVNRVIPDLIKIGGGMQIENIPLFTVLPIACVVPFDAGVIANGHNGCPVWFWDESPAKQAVAAFVNDKFAEVPSAAEAESNTEKTPTAELEKSPNKVGAETDAQSSVPTAQDKQDKDGENDASNEKGKSADTEKADDKEASDKTDKEPVAETEKQSGFWKRFFKKLFGHKENS